MYRPPAFAVDDIALLQATIRRRVLATVAAVIDGEIQLSYAPVVLDPSEGPFGTLRFHLARANPMAAMQDATRVKLSFLGPDAYVSPDWYETPGRVPTWNYSAVEADGRAERIEGDSLFRLVEDVTTAEEAKLAPKQPWTSAKVPEAKLTVLLNAIVGFAIRIERIEGKFKLSQNTSATDRAGVVRGLLSHGDARSLAMAAAMESQP